VVGVDIFSQDAKALA